MLSKIDRIKALLETGNRIDGSRLNEISHRFGSVLHRLKHEGWQIEKECLDAKTGYWVYWLVERPLVYIESQGRTDAVMPVSVSCGGAI